MKSTFIIFFVGICFFNMHNNEADAAWLKIVNNSRFMVQIEEVILYVPGDLDHKYLREMDVTPYYRAPPINPGVTIINDPIRHVLSHWGDVCLKIINAKGETAHRCEGAGCSDPDWPSHMTIVVKNRDEDCKNCTPFDDPTDIWIGKTAY